MFRELPELQPTTSEADDRLDALKVLLVPDVYSIRIDHKS